MTHKQTLEKLQEEFNLVYNTATSFKEDTFFKELETGKWSAAQNIEHLFLVVKPLVGLFNKPEIMLEKWGKCNHTSKTYKEIVKAYLKVVQGVKAPTGFATETVVGTKNDVINNLKSINQKFIERAGAFTEEELNSYQIPHPLLGLLNIREFTSFTLYHTRHHHATIKNLLVFQD
jgi:hypothetical protein